jgi:tRNA threonylcarbamoyladenosine biosynthesis protein TsaE
MQTTLPQIPKLAKKLAKSLKGGEILALIGDLGSGKTTFTQALGKALKIKHKITSPTFVLMNRYPFTISGKKLHLYHLDLYRLKNYKEAMALGLNEIWHDKSAITVIEWADKMGSRLPRKAKKIHFTSI